MIPTFTAITMEKGILTETDIPAEKTGMAAQVTEADAGKPADIAEKLKKYTRKVYKKEREEY